MVLVQASILEGPQDFGIWEKFFINLTVYKLVINIPLYQMSDLLNLLKTEIRIGMNEEFSIGKAQLRGSKQAHSHTSCFYKHLILSYCVYQKKSSAFEVT